jgi:hypothetical protein
MSVNAVVDQGLSSSACLSIISTAFGSNVHECAIYVAVYDAPIAQPPSHTKADREALSTSADLSKMDTILKAARLNKSLQQSQVHVYTYYAHCT